MNPSQVYQFLQGSMGVKLVLAWVLGAWVFHSILWALLGIRIGFINPFLFKMHRLGFSTKKFTVKVRSISCHISLFDLSNITVVIEGLNITLHKLKDGTSTPKEEHKRRRRTLHTLEDLESLDPDRPVSILCNSKFLNIFLKVYLLYFRFVGIRFMDVLVTSEETQTVMQVETFTTKVDVNSTDKKNVSIKSRVIQMKLNGHEVLDSCVLDAKATLDFKTGFLSGAVLTFDVRTIKIRIYTILKKYINLGFFDKLQPKKSHELLTEEDILDMLHEKLRGFCNVIRLVESIAVTLQGIHITEMPVVSKELLRCPNYKPLVFVHLKISSFVTSWERLFLESPGYGLMYDHTDRPFKIVYNLTGISVSMEHVGKTAPREVMTIPILNFNGSSNVAFQTLEAIVSGKESKSKLVLAGHLSEPTFDMSTDDISVAVRSAVDFLTYIHGEHGDVVGKNADYADAQKRSMAQKYEVAKNLSHVWPVMELKLGIENPVIMTKSLFNDTYYRILLFKLNMLALEFRSSREVINGAQHYVTRQKFDMHNSKIEFRNTETGLENRAVRLDNIAIKQQFEVLPQLKLTTSVHVDKTKVNFSNIHMLHGINFILSELDAAIVPQIREYRRFLNSLDMVCENGVCELPPLAAPADERSALQTIQDLIPYWVQRAEVICDSNTAIVGSRSLLLNKELVKSIDPQTKNDLINGELRMVELTIDRWNLVFLKCNGTSSDESSSSSSLEDDDKGLADTSSEGTNDKGGWAVEFHSSKVVGRIISERSSNKNTLHEKVFLKIPTSSIVLKPCDVDDRLVLKWNVGQIEALYSVITHFVLISTLHLVRNTILEFLLKNPIGEARRKTGKGIGLKILSAIDLHFSLDFVDMILVLPDKMKMRLEITDVSASGMLDKPILAAASYIRVCTESPTSPGYWARLVTSVGGGTRVNVPTIIGKLEGPWFELSNDSCHITYPHHLIIYKIFDNFSVLIKTLKQLHYSLKHNSDEIVINPRAKGPSKVPKMNLKSNRLIFSMEDDPFESELNMIFQIGLLEQKMRSEKTAEFDRRMVEEFESTKKPAAKTSTDDQLSGATKISRKKTFKSLHHSHSVSTFPLQSPSLKTPRDNIGVDPSEQKRRLQALHEGFSKSWIARVKVYKSQINKNFKESFEFLWGNLDTTHFPEGWNRKVLDFVNSPFLFGLILEGADIDIGPPSCGFDGLPDFLHDVGKGVPKDSQYSTLIPLHVDLRLTELRSHLRDYPLPLIHMPAISKGQPARLPAVRIHGDFIIGEDMILSKEEVREVFVPLVPGCSEFDEDNSYSIEVPKTLTSIKIYTNLDWEVNSELATQVTWGTSYQPCIQQIMLNMDNFTKPPIDPSEKVGFWDKIRANFHARINFHWLKAGNLHILFKGSMNPYAIGGESSGFMLGFRENVTLDINGKANPKEFIAAKADEVLFAVPNHFAQAVPVWSKPTSQAVLMWDVSTNFQQSAFGYYLTKGSVSDSAHSQSKTRSYLEKAVIRMKGGVQFNLAFFFERKMQDGVSRSSEFSPHYDVVLRNPKYVVDRDSYDAYDGFRSEYIHMGLTLISQQESSYNTIQMTPTFFQYFFAWWKLFSNTLPIRHGRLFGPDRVAKKFSRHLYSIKYQARLEPLFISHVYRDFELAVAGDNKVDCVGVKGRASKFVMDLHQRKELTLEHNANLGVTRKNMRMKFNIGTVELEEFDLRVLEGFFDKIDPTLADDTKSTDHIFETFDSDLSWFDLSDFTEVYEPVLDEKFRGNVNAYPLMYTPRFIYFKRHSYGDKHQLDADTGKQIEPFGSESFHECLVEGKPSVVTQQELFDKRIAELEAKKLQNLDLIARLVASNSPDNIKHARQLKVDNEELRHGLKFVKELADAFSSPETSELNKVSTFDFALDDNPAESSFGNRFVVHNMMLKWNDQSRDGFYRYVYLFETRGSFSTFEQHKSLAQLDDAIEAQRKADYNENIHGVSRVPTYESAHSDKKDDLSGSIDDARASQRMKFFKEELREIAVSFFYKTHDNYLVKLISPQIQLQCDVDTKTAVLVTAPKIELDIVAFDATEADNDCDENIFEQRFGAIFEDASIFLFHENEIVTTGKLFFNSSSYGSMTAWPPWLGVELCYDSALLADHVLMQKTSIMLRYDKSMNLIFGSDEVDVNRLSCDLSQAVLTCDAKQYYSLYTIVMELLIYNDPRTLKLKQMESKMSLSLDLTDLPAIKKRIVSLQAANRQAVLIIENFSSRLGAIDELEEDDLNLVRFARFEAAMELYLLMRVSVAGGRKSTGEADDYLEWNIRADDIKFHMLDEERSPFLDVILTNSHFKRMERSDRSDRNHIIIENLEVINLDRHSKLPVVFSAHEVKKKPKKITREADEEPLIHINWQMDYPVGGIRIMKKFEVAFQPIQISIEEVTGHKIMKYAFPDDTPTSVDSDTEDDDDEHQQRSGISRKSSFMSHRNGRGLSSIKSKDSNVSSQKNGGKPSPIPKVKLNGNSSGHANGISIPGTPRSSMSLNRKSRDDAIDGLLLSDANGSEDEDNQLDEMVQRASKYLSFVSFKLRSTVVAVTFRGKGSKKLINVTNFVFNLPEIHFSNRTYTLLDLTMYLKKVLIKALLSHTGSIIGNKLSTRSSAQKSFKNLSNYASNRISTFRDDD